MKFFLEKVDFFIIYDNLRIRTNRKLRRLTLVMNILHTSDWHLGSSLYGRKRYDESKNFLDWLSQIIKNEKIDILLVSGDIFDTTTPSNKAQSLYYNFLIQIANSKCKYIVVTAGNHDSPSFLTAPKALLGALNVFVVGAVPNDLNDEVFVLSNDNKNEHIIICAIPYLSDRDIRKCEDNESLDDKKKKSENGIKQHYLDVCAIAEQKQKELNSETPIIAMGHLFTSKGKTCEDGERDIFVGTLGNINKSTFPNSIDYLALGHLHIPQLVDKMDNMRYSGSPIPMSFGEAKQQKKVIAITFEKRVPVVNEINVPCFQKIRQIRGNMDDIISKIEKYKKEETGILLEIIYKGDEIASNLKSVIDELVADSQLEVLRIQNSRIVEKIMNREIEETLDQLTDKEVFEKCLTAHNTIEEDKIELRKTYLKAVKIMNEEDINKE